MDSYCPSSKEKVLLIRVPRMREPLHSTHDPRGTECGQLKITGPMGSSTSYICSKEIDAISVLRTPRDYEASITKNTLLNHIYAMYGYMLLCIVTYWIIA